jgi:hypothetical protein
MSHPGPEYPAPAQPGTPEGAWGASQGDPQAQPEKKSGARKWASLAGTVAVVGVGAAYSLTGGFGIGDPEVDDCVQMQGDTDFDVVDCDSADAEMKIVGIDDQELTRPDFEAADITDVCADFPATEYVLWIGDMVTEPGTIYCTEPV